MAPSSDVVKTRISVVQLELYIDTHAMNATSCYDGKKNLQTERWDQILLPVHGDGRPHIRFQMVSQNISAACCIL